MTDFDGLTFLELSRQLSGLPEESAVPEARHRTAVGRAYYACFHALRRQLCDPRGWHRIEKNGRKAYITHRKLRQLVQRKLPSGSVDLFDTLVEMREHADYHSWARGSVGPGPVCLCAQWDPEASENSRQAVEIAQRLLARASEAKTATLPSPLTFPFDEPREC
jgi:hypothetical protein